MVRCFRNGKDGRIACLAVERVITSLNRSSNGVTSENRSSGFVSRREKGTILVGGTLVVARVPLVNGRAMAATASADVTLLGPRLPAGSR
jgi:hypothetical protein